MRNKLCYYLETKTYAINLPDMLLNKGEPQTETEEEQKRNLQLNLGEAKPGA